MYRVSTSQLCSHERVEPAFAGCRKLNECLFFRPLFLSLVVGGVLVCGVWSSAQTSAQQTSVAAKDSQAVATISMALTAMGGESAFAAIQDTTVSGEAAPSDPSASPSQFIWKNMGISIRHEYAMPDGTHISTVNHGKGRRQEPSGKVTPIDIRAGLTIFPYHMPGTVLLSLLNAADRSLAVITDPSDDGALLHIQSIQSLSKPLLNPVTRQDWYFDPTTSLPVRVSFYLPDLRNQRLDGTATIVFSSWQTISGIQVPKSMQLLFDGSLQETFSLGTPVFNQGLQASTFQIQ